MTTPVIFIISYFIPNNFIHTAHTQNINFRILLVKDLDQGRLHAITIKPHQTTELGITLLREVRYFISFMGSLNF